MLFKKNKGRVKLKQQGWDKLNAKIKELRETIGFDSDIARTMGIAPNTLKKLEQDEAKYQTTRSHLIKVFAASYLGEPGEGTDFEEVWEERTPLPIVEVEVLPTTISDDISLLPQPTLVDEKVDEKSPNEEARPQEPFPFSNELQGFEELEQERQTLRFIAAPITSFIGRQEEARQIKAKLLSSSRLVTLTGTGGVGKTRLAIEVAEQAADHYNIVCFVKLASLEKDSGLVAAAIASTLGVREQTGRPIENTLLEFLRPKRVLLALDNCEHLLASCASITTTLLTGCKRLQILTTSREPLKIIGEVVYRVPSLLFPEAEQTSADESDITSTLLEYEAIQLFVERAQAVESNFKFTPYNAPLVAQICRRLDGIPLAIELAAAWVKTLSASEILSRLDDRFRLLTNGDRTALPRHQTLRALIDWSYNLLKPEEQALFCWLSVFAGGWTLEAAEAVGAGAGMEAQEVLKFLALLVDKSLVRMEQEQEKQPTRYYLLETLRQYAQERLDEGEEREIISQAYRDYFLKLAEDIRPKLRGAEQAYWLRVLDAEFANLRQALKLFLKEPAEGEKGLRLVAALQEFYWTRGHLSEGWQDTLAALQQVGAQAHTKRRADALCGAGGLAFTRGDYPEAISQLQQAVSMARQLPEIQPVLATALNNLGSVFTNQGDYSKARSLLEESQRIAEDIGDEYMIANALLNLGNIGYMQSAYGSASAYYSRSLAIRRKLGDELKIASTLWNLGATACGQKHYSTSNKLLEESLKIARKLEDKITISGVLCALGNLAWQQNEPVLSRSRYEESMAIEEALGNKQGVALCLGNFAQMDYKQGNYAAASVNLKKALEIFWETESQKYIMECLQDFASFAIKEEKAERCARLWGAATTVRAALDIPLAAAEREKQEADAAAGKALIGENEWNLAWKQGEGMTMEEAITYALAEETQPDTR